MKLRRWCGVLLAVGAGASGGACFMPHIVGVDGSVEADGGSDRVTDIGVGTGGGGGIAFPAGTGGIGNSGGGVGSGGAAGAGAATGGGPGGRGGGGAPGTGGAASGGRGASGGTIGSGGASPGTGGSPGTAGAASGGAPGGTGGRAGTGGAGTGGRGTGGAATGGIGTGGAGSGGRGTGGAGTGGNLACDPAKPFGAVMPLTAFNTAASDDAVFISKDGLTAYFSTNRAGGPGGYDIWAATRGSTVQEFGSPTVLGGINTTDHERIPMLASDGLLLFFSAGGDIHVAARPSESAPFTSSALLTGINSAANDASAWLSEDRTTIYFFSDRAGGAGGSDLYVGAFGANGVSNIRGLTAINAASDDTAPVVTRDGLTLYFSSTRAVAGQRGGADIWIARRESVADEFRDPLHVPELSSVVVDGVTWVSQDGCTVHVQSNRNSPTAVPITYDVFYATRPR
jgi:hypothetical protein